MTDSHNPTLRDEVYACIARCPDEPCGVCDDRAEQVLKLIADEVMKELETILRQNEDDQWGTNYEGVTDDLIERISELRKERK